MLQVSAFLLLACIAFALSGSMAYLKLPVPVQGRAVPSAISRVMGRARPFPDALLFCKVGCMSAAILVTIVPFFDMPQHLAAARCSAGVVMHRKSAPCIRGDSSADRGCINMVISARRYQVRQGGPRR